MPEVTWETASHGMRYIAYRKLEDGREARPEHEHEDGEDDARRGEAENGADEAPRHYGPERGDQHQRKQDDRQYDHGGTSLRPSGFSRSAG